MKKLVLILAVAFGASMVACSSSEKANEENANAEAEAPAVEVVEAVENDTLPVNDSTAIVAADTVVAVAETPAN